MHNVDETQHIILNETSQTQNECDFIYVILKNRQNLSMVIVLISKNCQIL